MKRATRQNPLTTVRDVDVVVSPRIGLSPKVFGATGGGSVDDTAAIQQAIDKTAVNPLLGVAVVSIPDGYYKVTASLVPKSNLVLQGMGPSTVIDFSTPASSGARLFSYASGSTLDNVTIQDMRVIGEGYNLASTTVSAAVFLNADTMSRIRVQRMQIENFQTGIYINSDVALHKPVVRDNVVMACSYAGIRLINSRDALIAGNVIDCTRTGIGNGLAGIVGIWCSNRADPTLCNRDLGVHNNHVINARYEGINLMAQLVSVTGNNVRGSGETGIVFEPIAFNAPNDSDAEGLSTISGNVVRDCVGQCIVVRHDPVNNDRASGRIAITGNTTSGGNVGIRVGQDTSTDFGPEEVAVTGNVCLKHATYGIRVIMGRRVTLAGNVSAGVNAGLDISSTTKVVTVVGGSYRGTGTNGDGIRIGDTASFIAIVGVSVDNVDRAGIFISGTAHDIAISNLICLDDQGVATMDYAVWNVSGTNVTVDGALVSGLTSASPYSGVNAVNGRSAATITSAVTLPAIPGVNHITFVGASGAPTLPTAVGNTSRYTIKNITTASRVIATTSSQTIDGTTTFAIAPDVSVDLVSDGANWRLV